MSLFLRDQEMREEGRMQEASEIARKFFINGASFELVRESVSILSDEELQKIYDEVMMEMETK